VAASGDGTSVAPYTRIFMEEHVENRGFVNTVIIAAIVVVILPLLAAIAAVGASFGIELSAGPGFGMFGAMGTPHVLVLGWTVIAAAIVAALVALLMRDLRPHA
jgi:hypothetical protein